MRRHIAALRQRRGIEAPGGSRLVDSRWRRATSWARGVVRRRSERDTSCWCAGRQTEALSQFISDTETWPLHCRVTSSLSDDEQWRHRPASTDARRCRRRLRSSYRWNQRS